MADRALTKIFGSVAVLDNPENKLETAISRYGDIRTFFSKYKNPVGIELEIEGVGSGIRKTIQETSLYWKYVEEGSLKYAGAEFVSSPLSGRNIDYALHEMAVLTENHSFTYGVRTSTHVHVNVSFLTESQLVYLIVLSGFFEPLLLQLCDELRRNNPYCYSITHLNILSLLSFSPDLKYCGINPAPVPKQLTLEYRYLHGTNDWRLIRRWVQCLCKLYYFVKFTEIPEIDRALRDALIGGHASLAKRVFGASLILFENVDECKKNALWALTSLVKGTKIQIGEW